MNDIKWPGSHKQHVKLFHTYSCECTRGASSMAVMRSARQHKKKKENLWNWWQTKRRQRRNNAWNVCHARHSLGHMHFAFAFYSHLLWNVMNSCLRFRVPRMRLKNAHIIRACCGTRARWKRMFVLELNVCLVNYCQINWMCRFARLNAFEWAQGSFGNTADASIWVKNQSKSSQNWDKLVRVRQNCVNWIE